MTSLSIVLAATLLLGTAAVSHSAVDTNMEILRDKIKADKKLLVANNMDLTEQEAKTFWPVYDSYQRDLDRINQRLGSTIMEYADALNKGPLSDSTAKKLLNEALAAEQDEVKLKQSYAQELAKVLPPAKVARYIQMENKIRSVVRSDLAQQIPLAY